MEEFPINFNIYGEYGTFERWWEAQFTETDCTETKTRRHQDLQEEEIDKIEENRHEHCMGNEGLSRVVSREEYYNRVK